MDVLVLTLRIIVAAVLLVVIAVNGEKSPARIGNDDPRGEFPASRGPEVLTILVVLVEVLTPLP
jgi:hypothetical protein